VSSNDQDRRCLHPLPPSLPPSLPPALPPSLRHGGPANVDLHGAKGSCPLLHHGAGRAQEEGLGHTAGR
jgi:hypothetical protein